MLHFTQKFLLSPQLQIPNSVMITYTTTPYTDLQPHSSQINCAMLP